MSTTLFCSFVSSQPLSPGSQKCLKVLTDKHGSGKIYQLTGHVVGTRDLDLSLNRGELVAIISEMDTRGDRRRWLVDAGGKTSPRHLTFSLEGMVFKIKHCFTF